MKKCYLARKVRIHPMKRMVVKRKAEIKMKPGALRPGDDGHGDDGDGDFGDDRKALVMIILPMIPITVKRSRAVRVCGAL